MAVASKARARTAIRRRTVSSTRRQTRAPARLALPTADLAGFVRRGRSRSIQKGRFRRFELASGLEVVAGDAGLLSSSESLREKSPEAVGMSSASRSPGTPGRSSAPVARAVALEVAEVAEPAGRVAPRRRGDGRRARASGGFKRGVPDVGARVHGRADRHRARVPSALSRGGRAPPAAHPAPRRARTRRRAQNRVA